MKVRTSWPSACWNSIESEKSYVSLNNSFWKLEPRFRLRTSLTASWSSSLRIMWKRWFCSVASATNWLRNITSLITLLCQSMWTVGDFSPRKLNFIQLFSMIWFIVKFVPGGHATFFGFVNSFSHIIMYSYLLSIGTFSNLKQNIPWFRKFRILLGVSFMNRYKSSIEICELKM